MEPLSPKRAPRWRMHAPLWALACATLAGLGGTASAATNNTHVLVKVDSQASATDRRGVGTALGATGHTALGTGWHVYEVPGDVSVAEAKASLSASEADLAVELDQTVLTPSAVSGDPLAAEQWALDSVRAEEAWGVRLSAAVTVAVIDTGIDLAHPDIANALWTNPGEQPGNGIDDDQNGYVDDVHGWDFAHGDATVFDGAAEDAHGTQVAGIIAAGRGNGVGMAGVAPNARIMALKFVDGGGGLSSAAIQAIRYAQGHGARVVNASFGGPHSQALCDAVAAAAAAGMTVVAAAGNDALDLDGGARIPATCPAAGVISVGASTPTDELAGFSNRGATSVDLVAPGEAVLTTVPGGGYGAISGTSVAAPHVAAAAALLIGRNPALDPGRVRQTLLQSAETAPALVGVTATGGRLDIARAMGLAAPAAWGIGASGDPGEHAPDYSPRRRVQLLRLSADAETLSPDRAAQVRYRLSGRGRVRFTVRRVSTKRVVSAFIRIGDRGDNVFLFTTRAGTSRHLPPGRYRLSARTTSRSSNARSLIIDVTPSAGLRRLRARP